ncbi:MAG: hypothetical protein R3D45_01630 [Rhizobiaceae bacterium]
MMIGNPNRRPPAMRAVGGGPTISGRYALVVSASPVNTVVVAGIVRDCGIKVVSTPPAGFAKIVETATPMFVIFDSDKQPDGIEPLLGWLSDRGETTRVPPVILVAGAGEAGKLDYPFFAVAAMPVTMENLRPVIERCLDGGSPRPA